MTNKAKTLAKVIPIKNKMIDKLLTMKQLHSLIIKIKDSDKYPIIRFATKKKAPVYLESKNLKTELVSDLFHVYFIHHYGVGKGLDGYMHFAGTPIFLKGGEDTEIRYYDFTVDTLVSIVEDPVILEAYRKQKLADLKYNLEHDFRIGSDPEIFVVSPEGQMIPAFLFLGDKKHPSKTAYPSNYGGNPMYWDGFQAEFTTKADTCLGWHMDSIAAGMRGVYDAANAKFPGAKLSIQSVFDIPPEQLKFAEQQHVNFGCMPSFNAYGLKVNMAPARRVPFRSAGGHIHFGIGKISEKRAQPIVKALDAILGVACVSLFAEIDCPRRRQLYGLPGEFRTPPHGLEYRPLSNAWLCHPMISNMVIDLARKVIVLSQEGFFEDAWEAETEEVISTIITCNVDAAKKMIKHNMNTFKQLLLASYDWATDNQATFLANIFLNGVSSIVADPNDLVKNWRLEETWITHCSYPGFYVESMFQLLNKTKKAKKDFRI
jgi:hypothetical protein